MFAKGAGHTDKGRVRDQNEDSWLVDDELGLYVVSDGMGGHAAGEVASSTAVATVARVVGESRETLDMARRGEQVDNEELAAIAENALLLAAGEIHELATSNRARSGMGCTVTMAITVGPRAVMAHVGDSRLYLCRDGSTSQLSTDHTVAHELVKAGVLKPEEERDNHYSHVLSRAVGTQPAVQVDTLVFDVLPGDLLVLSTDGLTDYVDDPQWLARQLRVDGELEAQAEELVSYANQSGGKDNITTVVVRIDAKAPYKTDIRELTADVHNKLEALESVFLFEDLTLRMQARVLEHCEIEPFEAADAVVDEGEPCSSLRIVMDGRFELQRDDESIGELAPGDYVGLTALLKKRPARATLRTLDSGKLLRLRNESFWALVRARPWLGIGLLERLGKRLGQRLDQTIDRCEGDDEVHLPGERF